MQNLPTPTPNQTGKGPILAVAFGCLGILMLGALVLIVVWGISYFQGYTPPTIFSSPTPGKTNTPLVPVTDTPSPTHTPSPSFTATQTPITFATPTATIIFHPPTIAPTRTKTPVPKPTKTRTPIPTTTPVSRVINDTQYDFNFNAWIGLDTRLALGKGMRCSSTKDEILSFEVSADTALLSIFLFKGPNQGKAKILIDSTPVETIDLYRASPQYRYKWTYIFSKPLKSHRVRIVVLHEKRNASTGYQVCFDGFMPGSVFTDDTNYSIRFGTWGGVWNGKALGGGYRLASTANASVTFTTRGRSFQWITARGPNYGQAVIYVDAIQVATVDLYFPTQLWQQSILIDNLGRGAHTVSIVVLGMNQAASGGSGVVFDGISIP